MPNLLTLDCRDDKGNLRMVVEAPKGSVVKLKYDPQLEAFELQRFISSSGYPYDWGFIPGTLAADGDPLDAMAIHDGHTWPGVLISCVGIALLKLTEEKDGEKERKRNDRLIVVPTARLAQTPRIDLEPATRVRLEQFFVATGALAKKRVSIEGWGSDGEAADAVDRASQAYRAKGQRATA